tara:strand:- start:56 stop:205 length:150 start_codon:yes stop_codon:yes gene_type:complete
MNELCILGMVIVGGVFGIGFIGLAIHISLDKTPKAYIRKPPKHLKPKKK